ncbi:MAG TPA: alcohol dehydrogenase catalytic domain-containing protein [Candidatus Polarisedimenticolia bacterium]|nr:alcohol dehydrogenase catalytic domain-containing protein [Candidatus Polarisedimenticolia bacterium]
MKAIRKVAPRPGALEWADVAMPPCGPTEVLLRVRAASLCGTDAHIYNWDGSVRDMILATTDQLRVPRIIGHEFCGEVLEVGRDVRGVGDSASEPIRPGDLVSAESHIVCGQCYQCRRGQFHVCTREKILGVHRDGGFAEYIALPASCAWLNDPAIVPVEVACIEEPFGNAVHAATEYDPRGQCVVIFGAGPIGLFSIIVAEAFGAERIIAVDTTPFRLELAARVGAHTALLTSPAPSGEPEARARERERIVGLIRDAAAPLEPDLVFEMSGHPDAIDTALRAVRRGGKVILFGLPKSSSVTLERYAEDVIFGGVTLKGIIGRKLYDTWKRTRELVSRPEVRSKIRSVITHTFPFERYEDAFQKMLARESGKVVLRITRD